MISFSDYSVFIECRSSFVIQTQVQILSNKRATKIFIHQKLMIKLYKSTFDTMNVFLTSVSSEKFPNTYPSLSYLKIMNFTMWDESYERFARQSGKVSLKSCIQMEYWWFTDKKIGYWRNTDERYQILMNIVRSWRKSWWIYWYW